MSYFKLNRESIIFEYLAKKRHSALILLLLIAKRAKRTNDHPDKTLQVGEAYIGDYTTYGVTEQIYKTDKALLKSTNQITTRSTNRGTIAKLVNPSFVDINEEEVTTRSTNKLSDNQRATNEQLTTNKNEKNEKNEKNNNDNNFLSPEKPIVTPKKRVFDDEPENAYTAKEKDEIFRILSEETAKDNARKEKQRGY